MKTDINQQHPKRCLDDCHNVTSHPLCGNWDCFFGGCKLLFYYNKTLGPIHPKINEEMRWIIEKVGCDSFKEII